MALSTRISQKISLRRAPIMDVNWRRVYALPTRHGFMVGLAVFGVFAISVRIQHNMLLLLAVALFVIFLISVIWGALNLHGLKGQIREQKTLICTDPSQILFHVAGPKSCFDLRLKSPSSPKKSKAASTALYQPHALTFTPQERGRVHAPPFLIETHFPFGLVRVWQWLFLPPLYVAPKPDFARAQLLMSGNQNFADQENDEAGAFNADSLEMWQEGIPLSRISWKQYAAKDRLLYKTGAASGHDLVRLHFNDIALSDYEAILSVLCGGVLLANEAGLSCEIALEDNVTKRFGVDELDDALRLLAMAGKGA